MLLETLAGVPANMAPVIVRYVGELDAEAAAAVSKSGKVAVFLGHSSCSNMSRSLSYGRACVSLWWLYEDFQQSGAVQY